MAKLMPEQLSMKNISCLILRFLIIGATKIFAENTILLDAGSTGSRIYIYDYDPLSPIDSISEIAHKRMNPALSSFVGDASGLASQLSLLIDFAHQHIPETLKSITNISLKATAGLRGIPLEQQAHLIEETKAILSHSGFHHSDDETRVISGQEEALYDFLGIWAVFRSKFHLVDFATADLGSSSQQFAFVQQGSRKFSNESSFTRPCRPNLKLSIPGEKPVDLFATSFQNMGLVAAMGEVLSTSPLTCLVQGISQNCTFFSPPVGTSFHPCLPPGAMIDGLKNPLEGKGDFDECKLMIERVLISKLPQDELRCLRETRPQRIIGIDNFAQVLEVLHLPRVNNMTSLSEGLWGTSPDEIAIAGRLICSRAWTDVLLDFPGFPSYRAQQACFAASFIYVILTEMYGIERHDDSTFFAAKEYAEKELSWAIGAAVYSTGGVHQMEIGDSFNVDTMINSRGRDGAYGSR